MNTPQYVIDTLSFILKSSDRRNISFIGNELSAAEIGPYISAFSNFLVFIKKQTAYVIWGVDAENNKVVGTSFSPNWANMDLSLSPNALYKFYTAEYDGDKVILLEIQAAQDTTVQCNGTEYLLWDHNVCTLSSYPKIEKEIWHNLDNAESFELQPALLNVAVTDIPNYLDFYKTFDLLGIRKPDTMIGVVNSLIDLQFIKEQNTGKYIITNLGALLAARKLQYFRSLQHKAIRVLTYQGNDVTQSAKEQIGGKGYLLGFEGLIEYIRRELPDHEVIDGATRKNISNLPLLSIRELVANALIHQDLSIPGGPIISIFPSRIEITNPGKPLIDPKRFIDTPPCSRNELIASTMHRAGFCEERGSGYDKVISLAEKDNYPAPQIIVSDMHTKVILQDKKDFNQLTKEERIRICYTHTCLNYVLHKPTNNTSLRLRFQLDSTERYKVSRVFRDTMKEQLITPKEGTGPKNQAYYPWWAI